MSVSAFAVDLGLCAVLISRPLSNIEVIAVIGLHALAAAIASAAAQVGAPPNAARARGSFFVLCFALSFFIPLVGGVGVQLMTRLGLTAKRKDAGDPWTALEIDEELAAEPVNVKQRGVSTSRISSVLGRRTPETAEQRFQAILQVKHLPANQQVQILKTALKDPSDEVRLFAFSRIEKFRADLEQNIKQFTNDLETADDLDSPLIHLRLAESLHEIAYLQLAEGAVLDHALRQARDHAAEALKAGSESGPASYLYGRIMLRLGEHDAAIKAFQQAVRSHYPRAKILPYMAECAFRQGRHGAVRTMLNDLARVTRDQSQLQPVVDFWR